MTTAAPQAQQPGIDFGRAFTFVSEDPGWPKKILIGGAFTLACAVLVGVPFVMGYFARVLRNTAAGATPLLPEWDDLAGLFDEGLRVTAVYLVYVLGALVVLGALAAFAFVPVFATAGSGRHGDALAPFATLGLVALYAAIVVFSLALAVYLPAALARAALTGSISEGLAWRANLDFIRANLANYALSVVGYLLASVLAQFGFILCCVGVFPAGFWSYMVLAFALGETARLGPSS
jgi:hypothetical protein